MNAEYKQFEEALAALLSHINECSIPRDQQAQLTTAEVKKIFNQLENRMKRFIDCFAWVGAKMVDGTHCFPIEGVADPDIDQLTYYFKALLDSE